MIKNLVRIVGSLLIFAATCPLQAQTPIEYVQVHTFGGINAIPAGGLVVGPCGMIMGNTYGNAASDGTGSTFGLIDMGRDRYDFRTLYRYDISGSPSNDGQYPNAGLTLSPDGTLVVGTTQLGGMGAGVFFGLDFMSALNAQNNGTGYSIQHFFDGTMEGGGSQGVVSLPPINTTSPVYFGTLFSDGPTGAGAVFSFDWKSSVLGTLHRWSPSGFDGAYPLGKLAFSISTAYLGPVLEVPGQTITNLDLSTVTVYGVTKSGGSNNWGTVYRVLGNGSNYLVLHNFNLGTTNGTTPLGGLVLYSNMLYGTTAGGGANSGGTIFAINTNGTGFKILVNLDFSTTGYSPHGDLFLSGHTLYGTTYGGGTNGGGTVYSVDITGSNFMVLHSFTTPVYNGNGGYTNLDGGYSSAGVIISRDHLWGVTSYGGTNGVGTIYRITLPQPPRLRLRPASTGLTISWPSWASNYLLLQSFNLPLTNWSTNHLTISDNGTNRSVVIPTTNKEAFFRLFNPTGF